MTTTKKHSTTNLKRMFQVSKNGFDFSTYIALFGINRIAEAQAELTAAEAEGMIIPEDPSISSYIFTDEFMEYMSGESETPSDDEPPFKSEGSEEQETEDEAPILFPYTAIVTYPNKTDTQHIYSHLQVEAECPKDAVNELDLIMAKTKFKDKWNLIALLEGRHTPVDHKSNIPAAGEMTWVELDEDGIVRELYSSRESAPCWDVINWDEFLDYGSTDEVKNDDPELFARVAEFNAFCMSSGLEHMYGTKSVQYLLEHPLASIPGTLSTTTDFAGGAGGELDESEAREHDELLDRLALSDYRDTYRGYSE